MKCSENIKEFDYYERILNFFEETETEKIESEEIENWTDHSIINLMKDIKDKKQLEDASIKDVIKNSIILILNLFDKKCKAQRNVSLESLSDEEKKEIKNSLMQVIN